jgi:predicted phage terminase large subunit-like protein
MANLDIELLPWQQEVWQDTHRFKVIAAGRRGGKTRFAVWRLLVEALQGVPLADYLYVAPTQGQARDIAWDLIKELGKDVIIPGGCHMNNMTIKLVNGVTIKLKGGDRPDTMRGLSIGFVVIDEYADIKPHVWEEIIRPALSDRQGHAVFIGTPMGRNHFYDLYNKARLGQLEGYAAWHFTTADNPYIPKEEIASAKKTMSSYAFRQEFMASFEAQGSAMFNENWIKYGEEPKDGEFYISVDLAGFEDSKAVSRQSSTLDDTAITIVKVNNDGWFVKEIISGRWTLNDTAIKIFEAVRLHRPVRMGIEKGIAQQAVMSPIRDLMKRTGRFFNIELLTHGNRKKNDRIMWALQGRFENGFITLNQSDWNMKFLDQLFQFPDPLTHDDLVDSLAYIDQLADIPYTIMDDFDGDEWEPIDDVAGY